MSWHAQLQLNYQFENHRTICRHDHTGPLRVLQSLYPEGDGICHNVLVHPPGGLVGGDTLDIDVVVQQGAHGLLTTPGATRFYRSESDLAVQTTRMHVASNARLEWLPLEALCYSGCLAENKLVMTLEAGAEMIGWDVTALGLPNANLPFDRGQFLQHIEMPRVWLERGLIKADDTRLLDGPLGFAGHRCIASVFLLTGSPMSRVQKEKAQDMARDVLKNHVLIESIGITSPNSQVIVVRVLSTVVEPAMDVLRRIRMAWRTEIWGLKNNPPPRIWAT